MKMQNIKYPYEQQGSQHTCPGCHKPRQFTRRTYARTGEAIADDVGICNNTVTCGYERLPTDFFKERNLSRRKSGSRIKRSPLEQIPIQPLPAKPIPVDFYTEQEMQDTIERDSGNNSFLKYLKNIFGEEKAISAISLYKLGTINFPWRGAVVFWQIDQLGNIRGGKITPFDHAGHRGSYITWVHSDKEFRWNEFGPTMLSNFHLEQCLFGSHVLGDNRNPICIVESEKTAVMCSILYPNKTWLATGGKTALTKLKYDAIKHLGRTIIVYPDRGCYVEWLEKSIDFLQGSNFRVSNLVENKPGLKDGDDLVDYLENIKRIPIIPY